MALGLTMIANLKQRIVEYLFEKSGFQVPLRESALKGPIFRSNNILTDEKKGCRNRYRFQRVINLFCSGFGSVVKSKINDFITPSDSLEINPGARYLEEKDDIEWIVVDTLSFWFDQLEKQHVIFSDDSRGNWGKIYATEIQSLLHFANNVSKKNWVFLTHTATDEEAVNFVKRTRASVKGATGKRGLEAYFDVVIFTNVYETNDDENPLGYGFQVKKTRDSLGFSVRSPMGMFPTPFLKSNNILKVFKYMDEYNTNRPQVSMLDPEE